MHKLFNLFKVNNVENHPLIYNLQLKIKENLLV